MTNNPLSIHACWCQLLDNIYVAESKEKRKKKRSEKEGKRVEKLLRRKHWKPRDLYGGSPNGI